MEMPRPATNVINSTEYRTEVLLVSSSYPSKETAKNPMIAVLQQWSKDWKVEQQVHSIQVASCQDIVDDFELLQSTKYFQILQLTTQ